MGDGDGSGAGDARNIHVATAGSIDSALAVIREKYPASFAKASTEPELRNANAELQGKKGQLTSVLAMLRTAAPADRKAFGEKVNLVKQEVEKAFEARLAELARARRDADLNARPFDLTLPGRPLAPVGHKHPISIVREEIVDVFRDLGFAVHDGPEVELEENNFTKLGFPPTTRRPTCRTASGRRPGCSSARIRATCRSAR